MLLNPEVLTINLLNILFFIFLLFGAIIAIKIIFKWDLDKNDTTQYNLLKQNYLAATIIKIVFYIKLPLFLFFIYTLDKLSNLIPGAMCAVGVIDAVDFGINLIVFKIINLYLFAFWLVLNKLDNSFITYPYTRLKYILFIIMFVIFVIEIVMEFNYFYNINPNKIVTCCGTLYSASSNNLIGYLIKTNPLIVVAIFYINYILLFISYKKDYIFSVVNVLFVISAISSLIAFFSIYIYELPTHHCPFCLLQSDYYYIGYFIYVFLVLGTFLGISSILNHSFKKYSLIFNSIVTFIYSFYVVFYYIRNGVFL